MDRHRLHVYTGSGKGKTTAAMGLCLRMLGHGHPVLAAQFMKDGSSGEVRLLASLPGARVLAAPSLPCFTFLMTPEQLAQAAQEHKRFAAGLSPEGAELVVLDELCCALSCGLLTRADAEPLLLRLLREAEVVVTGRDAPDWLRSMADYVSDIRAEKHPYATLQLPGREGIEW